MTIIIIPDETQNEIFSHWLENGEPIKYYIEKHKIRKHIINRIIDVKFKEMQKRIRLNKNKENE